jgi:hypothetical protein
VQEAEQGRRGGVHTSHLTVHFHRSIVTVG